ncbi:MAG: tetratricopeptide repeat protein [Thermoleophilia bacterium]|nr:tetratricopeptide repeat protein [Thermoleophilia bacterium]
MLLAACHERAGRFREARATYERALALPDRGRFDRRIRNGLKRARSLDRAAGISAVADALRVAGLAREQGKAELALAASSRAVELATSPGERTAALGCRASIVLDAGRPGEALELARRSIGIDPSRETNRQTYAVLVAALLEAGRTDDAKAEGERLLAANPTDPGSARALAGAYRRLFELTGERRWQAAAESCRARAAGPRLR